MDSTAEDFRQKVIDLGDGYKVKMRLTVGGLQYLETIYDKGIGKIDWNAGRITDFGHLLCALIISNYPDKSDKEVQTFVKSMDIGVLNNIAKELPSLLGMSGDADKKKPIRRGKRKTKKKTG